MTSENDSPVSDKPLAGPPSVQPESVGESREAATAAPPFAASTSTCSSRTIERREVADYAACARAQAGLLLEDEASSRPDLRVAQLLLRESFIAAASAITSETCQTLSQAKSALESHPGFAAAEGGQGRSLTIGAELGPESEPRLPVLREAESLVADLVAAAYGRPKPRRAPPGRRWLIGGALLVAVGVIAGPRLIRLMTHPRWKNYRWHSSSASSGFKADGTLGERGSAEFDLVFHTDLQTGPWVVIDMLESRSIDRVVIVNRRDCCFERGLPLVVEVGNDGVVFAPVGRQNTLFDTWTVDFAARDARYVRIRSESATILHLAEVRIP